MLNVNLRHQFYKFVKSCALVILGLCHFNAFAETQNVAVDLPRVAKHIKTLASDAFQGRGPLTEGEQLTIDYLAKQYQAMGLHGANTSDEPSTPLGAYLQAVPMAQITPDQNMTLKMGNLSFVSGRDFTARTEQINPKIELVDSPVVFVGYGINAPEYQWNDYADIDVVGKTVIVLVNDPGFATQNAELFTGNAMTYYGRWTYKYEEAARQGAKAVLIVHETAPAAYPWSVVESSNTGSKYTLVDSEQNKSKLPIMGWLQLAATEQVFKQSGLDYQQLKQQALQADFSPLTLKQSANLTLNNTISRATSHNVVAKINGSKYPDEYVLVGAHWDHFGTKQTPDGDIIYNGAVDNASGVAGTLEMARILMAKHKVTPFERSILFINFTAEETGLIGSEQFSKGEIIATKNMVALVNIDGMNVLDKVDYILQYGDGLSEMEDYLAKAAHAQKRKAKLDPRPQNGLFFRSDHFSMAKQGVPSLLFMSLGDTDPDYIAHKYHKAEDDYSADWSLGGVEQDLELMIDITETLANSRDWPKWKMDSDFKTSRETDLGK
ncbi:M28 family metallopeptidase [Paraglaciecola polaris]|uniref:Peptidase M28 n=1 Tax=Paraglaciecola polaris LMG 21857 TaxID=1129793 RepID=K6ZCD7_9ALTE|nr:M28 family metallopeptidase [Paraglaciecola polaris]GAC33756.1 peptidase M28 [Paraglaciecola polaris LMG 21857]|tara:strand:- start:782 stop:2434 length:1653 start_codon:yes stop_codon:yes gene_type:complete